MSLGQVNRGYSVLGLATAARMAPIRPPTPPPVEPKLGIAWGDFHQGFFSSVRALFTWPLISRKFLGGDYFRDCWVERRIPKRAVVAAALWHVVFLVSPFSLLTAVVRHNSAFDNTQLTWSGPIEDFPALEIAAKPKAKPISSEAAKRVALKGADAYHPRQRIVTDPVRPNHPRQTLINPKAPDLAPKLLPQLPNIVQLQAAAGPVRPRLEISAAVLAKLRPRQHRVATTKNEPAPEAPAFEQKPSDIQFAAATSGPARPKLELNAGAAPRVAKRVQAGDSEPAPELGPAQAASSGNPASLVALSAAPAPPKSDVQPPQGNLAARVSISPEGKKAGVPSGSPSENASGGTPPAVGSNSAGKSPVAVSISGGNPQPKTDSSAVGAAHPALSLPSSRELMTRPEPKADASQERDRTAPADFSTLPPGAKPEQIFADRRVYTMSVNMANLNSASGSWILNFSEKGTAQSGLPGGSSDLAGPLPVRKVDPKYPPELIEQHVEGEVVLYGVIRADGSVDSIQVARSLDPQLDANAKSAFAQWRFRAASKAGAAVDVEVIAHIPFKIRDDR